MDPQESDIDAVHRGGLFKLSMSEIGSRPSRHSGSRLRPQDRILRGFDTIQGILHSYTLHFQKVQVGRFLLV